MAPGAETFRKRMQETPYLVSHTNPSKLAMLRRSALTANLRAHAWPRDNEDSKATQRLQAAPQPVVLGAPELGTPHGTGRSRNAVSVRRQAHLENLPQLFMALLHSFDCL